MDIPANQFKRNLLARRHQVGMWVSLASRYSAEIVAGSGFDWLVVDTEHAPNDIESVLSQLQSMAAYPVSPVVRPTWNDAVQLKRVLDIGAQTVLVPYVQDADEAALAVAGTRYPPRGHRGAGGVMRASNFGRTPDYARRCEAELCVLVQIESRKGLDNLEAIAAVDGVDGLFIGPADLAASLGHTGNAAHPEVQSAIADAMRRILACGKAPGILALDEKTARRYMEQGSLFTAVGLDVAVLARETAKLAALYKA